MKRNEHQHEEITDTIARARKAQQENEQKHDVQLEIHGYGSQNLSNEIFGPGPDCHPED